jgi:phenylacetate-CoA ligase
MLDCWQFVYRSARVTAADRIVFAFSFGPFLGFWTAFEAAHQLGAHCVPAGGMSSQQRLALITAVRPTVVCCTPTYALRLADVARHDGLEELSRAGVRVLIVAGEPGGSIPATRDRIEQAWGARVIDHHGMTEVGPVSAECWEGPGALHVNEPEYICEVLDPSTLEDVGDGEAGELVLTTLGRIASPVIRYRTGDIVTRRSDPCACGRTLARLEGGIIGRSDDMVTVRGVNLYPAAVESVIRRFRDVAEFRSTVSAPGSLRELSVEIEPARDAENVPALVERVSTALRNALGLSVTVRCVASDTLPRFEMKAQRFVVS